jgi:tetratricopeptide (TPR) repeat protein
MKTKKAYTTIRLLAPAVFLAAMALTLPPPLRAQGDSSPIQTLLEKAHTLEVRGRMDMASQTWQQVLKADPSNAEALGGLARAAKLSGDVKASNSYIDQLKKVNPNDPNIAKVETMNTQQTNLAQLQQASKYAQGGQYPQAMNIYRQVFGGTPPPGDWALAYYETESATEDGRPHAIAGLRDLVSKYPQDSRYQITLGRILTYNPKTRAEGRLFLKRHPADPAATEALRQSLLWDAQNPASSTEIKAYLTKHPDEQLATALRNQPPPPRAQPAARSGGGGGGSTYTPPALTPQQQADLDAQRARSAEEQAAYRSLNAHHIEEAEERFKSILVVNPSSGPALAGMGYIRMQQSNFGGAISFLVEAKQNGVHDSGLETALNTSRFWYTMGEGQAALNENDLTTAQAKYQSALAMRPTSPEALEGLGGTLLKAQEPEPAIQLFERFVRAKPGALAAWRGLFMSQYQAGQPAAALATEKRIPATIHTQLMRDPDFLRTLASAFSAVGRDADAQRVLHSALELPFPPGGEGLKVETQLQYASLLQAANHLDQASGLYRQALATDPGNADGWVGLVRVQHGMGQNPQAVQTLESMPPSVYEAAMRDPGFETTVAAIYQGQGKLDIAQDLLEKSLAQQASAGQKVSAPIQLQLAGIYLQRNNPQQAYPIYQRVLSETPDRTDAWKGLLAALHTNGRDQEALAQIQQIPLPVRQKLEQDPEYLQNVAATYNSLGQPAQAALFQARVKQFYTLRHTNAPADIDIQDAWLLYNSGNETGLYRELMAIGSRADLSEPQRHTVQTIWANWAVRRANQLAAAGDTKRSIAVLNAAFHAFPDNPGVAKALASGYARAGFPKEAVAIFKAQDMTHATASDYKSAVGAALAANDNKDAETWLRYGLDAYPRDSQLLTLGAKFEQARGANGRAAEYYRASLAAMPPPDPGAELANELSRPNGNGNIRLPGQSQSQDLASLLNPGGVGNQVLAQTPTAPPPPPPAYLPNYGNAYGQAPVQLQGTTPQSGAPAQQYQPQPYGTPQYSTQPTGRPLPSTLGNYVPPQSSVVRPSSMDGFVLPAPKNPIRNASNGGIQSRPAAQAPHPAAVAEVQDQFGLSTARSGGSMQSASTGSSPSVEGPIIRMSATTSASPTQELAQLPEQAPARTPAEAEAQATRAYQYQQIQSAIERAQSHPLPITAQPLSQPQPVQQAYNPPPAPAGDVYGAYVPYVPPARTAVAINLGQNQTKVALPQPEMTDVVPQAHYVPNSRVKDPKYARADLAAAEAARIRRQQSNPVMVGQANPTDDYTTPPTQNAQYNSAQAQVDQLARPSARGQALPDTTSSVTANRSSTGDDDQQYPQPNRGPVSESSAPGRRTRRAAKPAPAQTATTTPLPGMAYPPVAQPLQPQPYPTIGATYPLGTPPSDAELVAKNVPPLRNYDGQVPLNPPANRGEREQTELELATLEASYSGWVGGTGIARYRSGTPGIDRLTDLESPVEASAVLGKRVRFTIVPRAVFLNSGAVVLDPGTGTIGRVFGSLNSTAITAPAQQSMSGVGGEAQMVTANFGLAVGYTPYEFLVRNITGHVRWRPGGGHFTFTGDRDSVKETQLSYAGLRDPGTISLTSPGNIWGGVVQTSGTLRFDVGNEKSGLYFAVTGGALNGFHVQDNKTFNGSGGVYFRVKVWPQYGSLNVGGSLYGSHFDHNNLGLGYGSGGYFSPNAYFLAGIPVSFTGHYKTDFHYVISGSVGLQTFQSDAEAFFPVDPTLQTGAMGGCSILQITTKTCGFTPALSVTGANYGVTAQGSYRIADHWYVGGYLTGNNTNNYNTISGGFFVRYLFRPQYPTEDYPTGIFPLDGFRPLKVP